MSSIKKVKAALPEHLKMLKKNEQFVVGPKWNETDNGVQVCIATNKKVQALKGRSCQRYCRIRPNWIICFNRCSHKTIPEEKLD